ncbi:50S ribosomal protein L24 [Anaerolineales bacterium]|jgi:large subunit ribosomal protein L24
MQRIKKGDTVEVIAGKDLGDRGEVVSVSTKDNRVIVSGVNTLKRHQKAKQTAGGQQIPAQIIEFDAPIDQSNVLVVCPACDKSTRVGFHSGKSGKVRFCKKCGKDID